MEWTKGEAIDILAECDLIEVSIKELRKKAGEVLMKPELSLVVNHPTTEVENDPNDWVWRLND